MRLPQSTVIYGNLLYSAMFCYILPTCFYYNIYNIRNVRNFYWILLSLPNSAKFCQDYDLKPILPYICVNWATKLIIYTLSSRFLISFFYVISWFYYIVHVYSLIISTLLYIIATCTHSVTYISFDWERLKGPQTVHKKLSYEKAQQYTKHLEEAWMVARTNLEKAQKLIKQQANKHRREPDFTEGDIV